MSVNTYAKYNCVDKSELCRALEVFSLPQSSLGSWYDAAILMLDCHGKMPAYPEAADQCPYA